MKSLAEFEKRVQSYLKHCPISEDDVMNMVFSEKFCCRFFNEMPLYDESRNDKWFPMYLAICCRKFNSLKEVIPSLRLMDDYDCDGKVIITNSGGYVDYIRIGLIKIHFKPIPLDEHIQAEYNLIADELDLIIARPSAFKTNELIRKFLMNFIDFEKTVSELRKDENMFGKGIYLFESITSEYDESTFEELLKVLNIYERKQKLTEILN